MTIAFALVISILAQDEAEYVGSKKCKMCHNKQYKSWLETAHAHNYQQLVEMGKTEDATCLKCHSTGYGKPGGFKPGSEDLTQDPVLRGTGCEACHGPGSKHVALPKEQKKGSMGQVKQGTCETCHMPHGGHPDLGQAIRPVLERKLKELQDRIAKL